MITTNRTFGAEFEHLSPVNQEALASALTGAGFQAIALRWGQRAPAGYWGVTTDSSIRDVPAGFMGLELVSPILSGEAGMEAVRRACQVLTGLGATVNKHCGFHVHVGARDIALPALKSLVLFYAQHETAIDKLMPRSRRESNCNYARALAATPEAVNAATSTEQLAYAVKNNSTRETGDSGLRYVKLNLTSFWKHGTVEFRQHSATIDAQKATMWINVCLRMVENAIAKPFQSVPVATAPSYRLRSRTARRFVEMASRPEGVTREEFAAAMGWDEPRRMIDERATGVTLRRVRNGRVVRFHIDTPAAPVFEAFVKVEDPTEMVAKLNLTAFEQTYWTARVQTVART